MYTNREETPPRSKLWLWAGIPGAIVLALFTWFMCTYTVTVEPGEWGVINDKPYLPFGHEGVRAEPLKEGRMRLYYSSTVQHVTMTPKSENVDVDDYSSKDNILLDFHTTIQYRITDPVVLAQNFGVVDWFKNNVRNQYLAIVREAVKKRTMAEMMSDVATAKDIDDEVTKGLIALIKEEKLPVQILNVSLGRAKPNDKVLEQMNITASEQQRKNSLVAATQAEQQREAEQIAKARADNAYRNAMNLSPEQFVELERIRRYSEACMKSPHCVVTSGQGQGVLVNAASAAAKK